jgi:hypothetical protein
MPSGQYPDKGSPFSQITKRSRDIGSGKKVWKLKKKIGNILKTDKELEIKS